MKLFCSLPIALALCVAAGIPPASAADAAQDHNVNFRGDLVVSPCTIADSEQGIHVHFNAMSARALYNGPSSSVAFALHLTNCDTQVADRVAVTFAGSEDAQLPGLLAVSAGDSEASGIAIGLSDQTGAAVNINQPSAAFRLLDGDNTLNFNAWVQGEPQAIQDRQIMPGDFLATATLMLAYE